MSTITTLGVTGMTCSNCVSHVTKELDTIDGVENVIVDLRTGETSEVNVFSDEPLDDAALREAIDEAGYEVVSLTVLNDALAAQSAEEAEHAEERTAHQCSCGCGGKGSGAGPAYNAGMGTYSITMPPRN